MGELGRSVFLNRKTCFPIYRFLSSVQGAGFSFAEASVIAVVSEEEMGGLGYEAPTRSNFICFVFEVSFFKNVFPA